MPISKTNFIVSNLRQIYLYIFICLILDTLFSKLVLHEASISIVFEYRGKDTKQSGAELCQAHAKLVLLA